MDDKWTAEAARLLPCQCDAESAPISATHRQGCPAIHRPAVVAALEKAAAEGAEELRAEVARLNNKFPCGHRIIDWDDSYSECVFCKIQQQAFDYDKLPHSVIECHDKIEELEAVRAAAVVQGLELVIEILRTSPTYTISKYWLVAAIQAEITKREAEARGRAG